MKTISIKISFHDKKNNNKKTERDTIWIMGAILLQEDISILDTNQWIQKGRSVVLYSG